MNGMTDDAQFKFKVGDRVRHAAGGREAQVIVDRLIHDCHGGRQILYRLRNGFPYGVHGLTPYIEITEPELVPDRPYCQGCAYGIPIVDAPGMVGGRAHVEAGGRQSCVHQNPGIE